MSDLRRGDVVLVALDPTVGSEQAGTRPAVVVQNDTGNRFSPTTIVAPVTTRYEPGKFPFQVELLAAEEPVDRDTAVQCDQIRTVSVEDRVLERFGRLSPEAMDRVDDAIRISLGLDGGY
ncbi:type II toxin-antitoxin system PemK/MazF family toxin [Halomarina pelagica]|uniref:type II toxin-antitoxin system PemK/MazF family toxin n=1 Tax=Halomarina pelagica TaxID=2961599 RepID=UPI0020C1DC89|nr:type II toxin-antitoxin system PemK/MazF family toxin [Halomarina sp. BND7]